MKILITGGAGFIGSALIRYLLHNTEHSVVNIDKLTYAGNLESLQEVSDNSRYSFEQVDICNSAVLKRIFEQYQPDAVMHLAAESHVDTSIRNPSIFIETNIVGTYTLLEVTRQYWNTLSKERKHVFRFQHISTDEVYGDAHASTVLYTEVTPYAPSSPYAASKAGADHLVRAWHRTYNLPILITNCSNNYGPYQYPEKLIPLTIHRALAEKSIPIYGTGLQIRDWLYVEDHVRALYRVLTFGRIGETYNISAHTERTNIDVITKICRLLDELVPQRSVLLDSYTALITYVQDRPGHDQRYALSAKKLQQELDWFPQETFETGLRKTVEWYLKNQ